MRESFRQILSPLRSPTYAALFWLNGRPHSLIGYKHRPWLCWIGVVVIYVLFWPFIEKDETGDPFTERRIYKETA